jgi:hypothetical protein
LLATLFDGRTNLGMVRFYAQETAGRITEILEDISSQNRTADLTTEFGNRAEDALDKLF